ncbi:hypothetical protein [Nonomuraea soli]|uniref:Uncharacterized protein n=1 Tax=Nonomuraea soli TaxID=1032476 RepID=A0A7W0CD50_9ACTN|nr:hypothetical protein [Nonomuraea soli]MBA2888809.1 hypothetical protein [Nonomuraea soli]
MTLLEQRYRNVLKLLPASYRAEREEEMVAAFLEAYDAPDETGPRPPWGEIFSVAALAVRVRLSWRPRGAAWGETVRLTALFGIGLQAVLSSATLMSALADPLSDRLYEAANLGLAICWLLAFATLARGAVRPARSLALAGLAFTVFQQVAITLAFGDIAFESWLGTTSMAVVAALALLLGHHGGSTTPVLPWLVIVPAMAVGLVYYVSASVLTSGPAPGLDESWMWIWPWASGEGVAALLLTVGSVSALTRRPVHAPAALALGVLGLPLLASRLPLLLDHQFSQAIVISGAAQLALLGVLVPALWVRGLRAMPSSGREDPRAVL